MDDNAFAKLLSLLIIFFIMSGFTYWFIISVPYLQHHPLRLAMAIVALLILLK